MKVISLLHDKKLIKKIKRKRFRTERQNMQTFTKNYKNAMNRA